MNYKIQHITNKKKLQGSLNPQYLTIHSTANLKSTSQNERDWLNNNSNTTTTGFHIAVDDKEAIECIPLDVKAHHTGNSLGNNTSIGLEICESGDRQKTLDNAVEITVKILSQFGWGVDKLKRHYDWSKKNCPRILNYNNWEGWQKFINDVEKKIGGKSMALRKGDKSNEVKKLQQNLISLGYNFGSYGADGSYGSATENTVKQFQKNNKLAVDGVAGPATQKKVQELISSKPATGNDYLTKAELKKILQDVISKL